MKTVVTHMSVDLDAIASTWLIKSYMPEWEDADVAFVGSGKVWEDVEVDSNPNVIYVDTGLGKFDHHQTREHTCATKRVYEYLREKEYVPAKQVKALDRLVALITDLDHFAEVNYPDAAADWYDLELYQLVGSLKYSLGSDSRTVNAVFPLLDAALQVFMSKVKAEDEIQKGFVMQTKWGKSIVMNTSNHEAMKLAQKMGFTLVITRDPDKGFVRIKIPPYVKQDLDPLYAKIKATDAKASWFYHVSKHVLLNDASQNPSAVPSSLSSNQLIEIIKGV